MNILMLTSDFYPNIGGIANHIYYLSKELSQKNNVYIYFISNKYNKKNYSMGKITIYRETISERFYYIKALYHSIKILKLIKEKDIKLINYHTLFPDCIILNFIRILNRNIKIVFTNHSSGFIAIYKNSQKSAILNKMKHKLYLHLFGSAADCIICPSEELKNISKRVYKNKKIIFIPNGVNTDIFRPKKGKTKDDDSFNVLIPRRLAPKNGVLYGIQSLAYLPKSVLKNIKFYVAGDNDNYAQEKMEIEEFLEKNNYFEYVKFMGAIKNSKMADIYNDSDIVLIPSLVEAVSISALEAMACGKPIIASKVGGLPFIIKHEFNGFLVKPRNPKEIAKYIHKMFLKKKNNKESFLQMGINSRLLVEDNFTWKIVAKRIMEFYKKC